MSEYIIVNKVSSEFQKLLNQWKHKYIFKILFIKYHKEINGFTAIIEREEITAGLDY